MTAINYTEATNALNSRLPDKVVEIESYPAQAQIKGTYWRLILVCPWWLDSPEGRGFNYEHIEYEDESRLLQSLLGKTVLRFSFADDDPRIALLTFSNGWTLKFETDSDYEPWKLVLPEGELVAALSDFDE